MKVRVQRESHNSNQNSCSVNQGEKHGLVTSVTKAYVSCVVFFKKNKVEEIDNLNQESRIEYYLKKFYNN